MPDEDKLAFLDQPRDDHGRFASQQVEPAPVETPAPPPPEPQAPIEPAKTEPQAPSQVPPGYIPLAAQLDERDKRQAAERRAAEFERKLEEATRKPAERIDPLVDPDGWERSQQQQREQDKWDLKTTFSHQFAVRQHGPEAVKAAEDWLGQELQSNPAFFQTIERQQDPYDFVVRAHKRHQAMSKIGDDEPETWAEKWARENGYVKADQPPQPGAPNVVTPSPQPTPLPKPSLASAPAASGKAPSVPVGHGAAFDAAFK